MEAVLEGLMTHAHPALKIIRFILVGLLAVLAVLLMGGVVLALVAMLAVAALARASQRTVLAIDRAIRSGPQPRPEALPEHGLGAGLLPPHEPDRERTRSRRSGAAVSTFAVRHGTPSVSS